VSFIGRGALPYLSRIIVRTIGVLRYYFGRGLVVSGSRSPDDIVVVS
jgi:hypothetical protein